MSKRTWIVLCAAVVLSVAQLASADPASPADSLQLHGFTVEYGRVGLDKVKKMQPSLEHQMDIVEQSNVPAPVLEFFKSVPVIMVADLDTGFGHANMDEIGRASCRERV